MMTETRKKIQAKLRRKFHYSTKLNYYRRGAAIQKTSFIKDDVKGVITFVYAGNIWNDKPIHIMSETYAGDVLTSIVCYDFSEENVLKNSKKREENCNNIIEDIDHSSMYDVQMICVELKPPKKLKHTFLDTSMYKEKDV